MSTEPGPAPEPQIDENPDPGNEVGGTDAVEEPDTLPPLMRDVPQSAQIDGEEIPDDLKKPEGRDREADIEDPSTEPSA